MPPRFYCESLPDAGLPDAVCALEADETRHARKVLRLQPGELVELFDGSGVLVEAEIAGYQDGRAVCRERSRRLVAAVKPEVTVAVAVPKGPRAEAMVNQLAQLGADRLVPLLCERGVVEPGAGKLERFRRAALAAAKQSGRPTLMEVSPAVGLSRLLEDDHGRGLILDPGGERLVGLDAVWKSAERVTLLVGPEGGFTADEVRLATEAGFATWCVNENILRIETAAMSAVAVLRYLTT